MCGCCLRPTVEQTGVLLLGSHSRAAFRLTAVPSEPGHLRLWRLVFHVHDIRCQTAAAVCKLTYSTKAVTVIGSANDIFSPIGASFRMAGQQ